MGTDLVASEQRANLPVAANAAVMVAVEKYGNWIYDASIFGCKTKGQAMMMAWSWLMKNKDPLEIKRQYHFINGELTMKYRVMASHFLKAGGKIKPIVRTPFQAEAELTYQGITTTFAYSLEEAVEEDYLWTKDALMGKTPRFDKKGCLNRAALKDNWSTPRRRMQMLWARAVTDGIATIAADVTDGYYAAEEIGDIIEDEASLPDESFIDSPTPPKQITETVEAVFEPKKEVESNEPVKPESVKPTGPVGDSNQAMVPGVTSAEGTSNTNEVQSVPKQEAAPVREVATDRANGPATNEQLAGLRELKTALSLDTPTWKQMLAIYQVASANQLTFADADDFTVTLMRIQEERRVTADQAGFFGTT